ncbi:L-serine ammonia-lyase [Rhodococcus koreensis]|uniref:L-serine dehydratase n=1 Tax=Rhodococcus koreensis TaxID=99653 RepID=A0A1H4IGP5_9NOCA|nr:L-serine ammonia-lyase [Rhodococcus koreensis]SEB33241.1 L-serine ammonia-lyase [Rhodococcus koreensis]
MTVSVFDLFSVGIGPSSSHTVGPMRAAARFAGELRSLRVLDYIDEVHVEVYGSLAATGAGHGTFTALLLGLEGLHPDTLEVDEMERVVARQRTDRRVRLGGTHLISLDEERLIKRPLTVLDYHPNAVKFRAISDTHGDLLESIFYSVGGGFIVSEEEKNRPPEHEGSSPFSFSTAAELLTLTEQYRLAVSDVMMQHELTLRPEREIVKEILHIRDVMEQCQYNGMQRTGNLPGNLNVRRRAHTWHQRLRDEDPDKSPEHAEDWVNLVALAVNEENASGGRVVTAPTNGAAGIIPAVLHFATHYTTAGREDPDDVALRFLLTAGAIGALYKQQASISGAEVGCQGEVGSAASMAAGALAEILGGTPQQVENAAEIAMEHCLGLTCDPIGGLVQIPCIERNAISANKAITAARMAMRGDGTHRVSLDEVIATMRATGLDMSSKYKETSTGGLAVTVAVNVVEC